MQSLEAACDEGERAVKRLKALRAAALPLASPKEDSQASSNTFDFDVRPLRFDIFQELQKLCDEDETDDDDDDNEDDQRVRYKALILERLVEREKLNTVILNLYPGNKGYSLAFRLQDRSSGNMCFKDEELIQTVTQGYDQDTILRYIKNEEIPPFILDELDKFDFLFYSGCVIAEVRNYRQAFPGNKCYTHHVLLRPTQKTVLADINNLTRHRPDFTTEDRDVLESQIAMAHTPELCLDPDPDLEEQLTAIHNRARVWNGQAFHKLAHKTSQMAASRKRKLAHFTKHRGLELLDFCKAKKSRPSRTKGARQSEEAKTVIPAPSLVEPALDPPSRPIAIEELRTLARPEITPDCTLYRIEDHILEKVQDRDRIYHITLSILYRPSNMEFWGELYLDRDFKKGERNGTFCRFYLGTRTLAHRFVYQYTEIFTESGRKTNVRVRSIVHINEPEEVIWSSNAFAYLPQRLRNPKAHMEQMNRAMQALQFDRPTNLQFLVEKVVKGDLDNDLYTPTDLKSIQMTSQKLEIEALATELELSWQQTQAAAAEEAKRQAAAAQQKRLANSNIISLLNSSPAITVNSNASAAVVNAINNQAGLASNHRQLQRRISATGGTRVLGHGKIIALNNHNRLELNAQPQTVTLTGRQLVAAQPQTVTLTSAGSGTNFTYTAVPVKQQVVPRIALSHQTDSGSESALGALLVGTPAADRPEIASPNHANSLVFEKLAGGSTSGQNFKTPSPSTAQFLVSSPTKTNTVISPMSSPPPQTSNTTLNVQSLNLAQLQSIPGLHNVQFQLQNLSQPISLAVNVGGQLAGAGTSKGQLLMSLPTAQAQQATSSIAGQPVQVINASGSGAGSSQLAQLVSSGTVKNVTHHGLRTATGSQTLQLTPGNHQFQLISQLQRPARQQSVPTQASITSRTLQRTPIAIKMAPNSNFNQSGLEPVQHYQQLRIQQKGLEDVIGKLRRTGSEQP